jgi:hypothetical protein
MQIEVAGFSAETTLGIRQNSGGAEKFPDERSDVSLLWYCTRNGKVWKIPSNVAHFLKVQRAIEDAVAFYKEIM